MMVLPRKANQSYKIKLDFNEVTDHESAQIEYNKIDNLKLKEVM